MEAAIKSLLRDFRLRSTDCRNEVLNLFLDKNIALSHGDLEKDLEHNFDRVTLYRTLRTFVDKGILHKVIDEGSTKYALCSDACSIEGHNHQHVHFKCNKCGNTTCIDEIEVPGINLPAGYVAREFNFLVEGVCASCS